MVGVPGLHVGGQHVPDVGQQVPEVGVGQQVPEVGVGQHVVGGQHGVVWQQIGWASLVATPGGTGQHGTM